MGSLLPSLSRCTCLNLFLLNNLQYLILNYFHVKKEVTVFEVRLVNHSFSKAFKIALIGWIKAGSPKTPSFVYM